MTSTSTGILYVTATPIGNMGDLTPRAQEILSSVDLVLVEDTRVYGRLKQKLGISTPAISYHDQNEKHRVAEIVERLKSGQSIALISDAGTPTISDPGFRVVRACKENSIDVRAIPGSCAAVAALSISGFETDRFLFEGFLPMKPGKRKSCLERILQSDTTTIVYESPHKILKTLSAIAEIDPERELCICRELTKKFEETLHGTAEQLSEQLEKNSKVKGEFVLIIRRSSP